jgi:hypothetical protein
MLTNWPLIAAALLFAVVLCGTAYEALLLAREYARDR